MLTFLQKVNPFVSTFWKIFYLLFIGVQYCIWILFKNIFTFFLFLSERDVCFIASLTKNCSCLSWINLLRDENDVSNASDAYATAIPEFKVVFYDHEDLLLLRKNSIPKTMHASYE